MTIEQLMARGAKRKASSPAVASDAKRHAACEALTSLATRVDALAAELRAVRSALDALPSRVAALVVRQLRTERVVVGDAEPASAATMRDLDELPPPSEAASSHGDPEWRTWTWGGDRVQHFVPPEWEFPTGTTVEAMWNLWQFGDRSTGIRPYRELSVKHDIDAKHRMRHSRAKVVMAAVESIARDQGLLASSQQVSSMSAAEGDRVFEAAFHVLLGLLYDEVPSRAGEVTLGTIYNRLCRSRSAHADLRA